MLFWHAGSAYFYAMKNIIDSYRSIVIQIATPYSTGGTGFYLAQYGWIVTNEHVVRDNREVVVQGEQLSKQLAKVVYADPRHDLAFLSIENLPALDPVPLAPADTCSIGDVVIAIGHPFGLKLTTTRGIISNMSYDRGGIFYIQHDAALNPGNSGGPLINEQGEIIGVNTFMIKNGQNIGFSLPVQYLASSLEEYHAHHGSIAVRCEACGNLVLDDTIDQRYCPHCGAEVELPSEAVIFEPIGVARTVEEMLDTLGYEVKLARSGPNYWEIFHGSAKINISYYEETGLLTCDAYLCQLPRNNIKPIYEYLLRENYTLESLNLSIRNQDIILSLLIYDRYLNMETGTKLFKYLFERADYYDNLLVENFGAFW